MDIEMDEYLTTAELSARIKFPKQTIYNLICKGEFKLGEHYLKPLPRKILFKWSAVLAWLEREDQEGGDGNEEAGRDANPRGPCISRAVYRINV